MKVKLNHMLKSYSGACDGLVFYYHPILKRNFCRQHVKPKLSTANNRMAAISRNLKALSPSPGWQEDIDMYGRLLSSHNQQSGTNIVNWYGWYAKLMHRMAKEMDVNLETLTRAEIISRDLPCRTVKAAIEAGLLEAVPNHVLFIREF